MNPKIRLLLTVDSFIIAAFGLIGPIYAIYVEKIGGDILDAGLAFAIYSISLGGISYFIGKLGDRIKNEYAMIFSGVLISTAGFFSYLLVQNSFQLMIVQAILGVGQAMYNPMYDVIFSTNIDNKKKDSEWADWESLNFLITGVSAIIGAWIADLFGFKILFVIMGLCSLTSLLLIPQLKQKSERGKKS